MNHGFNYGTAYNEFVKDGGYDNQFPDKDWESQRIGNIVLRLMGGYNRKKISVFEVGTGTGMLAVPIIKANNEYKGIDISIEACKVAKQYGLKHDVHVNVNWADILRYNDDRKYDVILGMTGVLSFFFRDSDRKWCAKKMMEMLKPGGLLIVSNYNGCAIEVPLHKTRQNPDTYYGVTRDYIAERIIRSKHYIGNNGKETFLEVNAFKLFKNEVEDYFKPYGLKNYDWHDPSTTGYYQPILTGLKAS